MNELNLVSARCCLSHGDDCDPYTMKTASPMIPWYFRLLIEGSLAEDVTYRLLQALMFQYIWVTQLLCRVLKAAQVEVETQEFSIIYQLEVLFERKVDFWHFGMAADLFPELEMKLQKKISFSNIQHLLRSRSDRTPSYPILSYLICYRWDRIISQTTSEVLVRIGCRLGSESDGCPPCRDACFC